MRPVSSAALTTLTKSCFWWPLTAKSRWAICLLPPWSERIPGGGTGFYPDWLETPVRVGALNNLFILPEYRGTGLGDALTSKGLEWLRALPGARYLFVDVSEGNNAADFYARYGFKFSHDVLGGIIKAYYQEI